MTDFATSLREEAEPAALSAELAHMLECIRCVDTVCGLVLSKEEASLLAAHLAESARALSLEKQRVAEAEARWLQLADDIRKAVIACGPPFTAQAQAAFRNNTNGAGTAGAWGYGVSHGRATMAADLLNAVGL